MKLSTFISDTVSGEHRITKGETVEEVCKFSRLVDSVFILPLLEMCCHFFRNHLMIFRGLREYCYEFCFFLTFLFFFALSMRIPEIE